MRCDQNMGLTEKAQQLVEGAVLVVWHNTYFGLYGNEYGLMQYQLPDGSIYREVVQEIKYDSGPMFFLALEKEDGAPVSNSLWLQNQMWPDGVPQPALVNT